MFSRPVYSGWKPVPSSRMAEILPLTRDAAGGAVERAGEDFQQRALACAVAADHAHHLAAPDIEGDVPQRPELLVARLAGDHLPEHVRRPAVDLVHLGEIADFDDRFRVLRFHRPTDAVSEIFAFVTHP